MGRVLLEGGKSLIFHVIPVISVQSVFDDRLRVTSCSLPIYDIVE